MDRRALWWLGGITVAAAAVRFSTLGQQSYHHDELITAMRVLSGSFGHMLHEVRVSESNPPLYYVLAWPWARVFGFGEAGLRSLSALFGVAVIPVAYLIGRQLASRRAGLVLAALVAFSPMLIWYSQEARSYAFLVFFGALSVLFFVRALDSLRGLDIGLWAVASALALCSHYFAFFLVGVEALWLAISLRQEWRALLPAFAGLGVVALALAPLISAQANPKHIGWITNTPLPTRLVDGGAAFLIGETGSVIGETPRNGFALVPLALIAAALVLVAVRGGFRERRGAAIGAVLGLSVVAIAVGAALAGKDYVLQRNLLPALLPLALAVALGCAAAGARRLGLGLAVVLCAYLVAFDVYVTQTPSLQRLELRGAAAVLGAPHDRRAVVGWRDAAQGFEWYLGDGAQRLYSGTERVREVDVVGKPRSTRRPVNLPPAFHLARRQDLPRLTVSRYLSRRPMLIHFKTLHELPTGFGGNSVVIDGPLPRQSAAGARL